MAFLRSGLFEDAEPVIEGRRVRLRPYLTTDYPAWAELRAQSRQHLQPWEPLWPHDDLTKLAYRHRLRHYHREAREDLGYAFAIIGKDSGSILGGLSLCNIRRGVTQSAILGYWLGLPYVGHGLMTEAVGTLLPHAFEVIRLHRIEAVTQPHNMPSIRVLEHCGFTREGYLRQAIKINGIWADHMLYAKLVTDGRAGQSLAAQGPAGHRVRQGTWPA